MPFVETDNDELWQTGHFDEENIDRMESARGEEPRCGLQNEKGKNVERGLVRKQSIGLDPVEVINWEEDMIRKYSYPSIVMIVYWKRYCKRRE